MKTGGLIFLLFFSMGCTHSVHLSHFSDIHPFSKKKDASRINAESEQSTILGMVGQTEYVDQAFSKLKKQCEDGEITGIQTRYSTSHGFFSWTNKIKMIAYCI